MKRRIKKARISHLSLVPRGANKMPVLYKEDGQVELQALVKQGTDEGEILAVVYAPDVTDAQGDVASADVIKEMAYDAMRRGVEIDVRHNLKPLTKEQAYVAESFLIQKGDQRFQGFKDYSGNAIPSLEGAWATVIKVDDPEIRKAFREGQFNGVSMYGQAEVEAIKESTDTEQFLSKLAEALVPSLPSEEITMNKEELEALLAQREDALVAKMGELLAKSQEPPAADDSDETVFKGDLTNPADVAAHVERLKAQQLRKSIDTGSLEQMLALQKALGETPEVESRVSTLEKSIAQILKGSSVERTAPVRKSLPAVSWDHDMLAKEDDAAECIALGKQMAAWLDSKEAD